MKYFFSSCCKVRNPNLNITNENTSNMSTKTPFCPCCKSAGKSKTEYTSHFVKDKPGPDGVVVCPTLQSQECRYCHEKGHTPKFCPKLTTRGKTKRVASYRSVQATYEMSANQRRQVERESAVLSQQKLKGRRECIDSILHENRYWFNVLRREEEINKCLFAKTLFRLSDEQLARARGWVAGEERLQPFHTEYNLADEQEAMEEADREFEYLETQTLRRPKLTRRTAMGVNELWSDVAGRTC